MEDIKNSFATTKDPFDSRFNPLIDEKVVIDQDGFLFKQSEVQYFLGRTGTSLVELASLMLKSVFELMEKALNSKELSDCKIIYGELVRIIAPENAPVEIDSLRNELIEEKMKPEIESNPAKFRLSEKHIRGLQNYHKQTGKNASTIYDELGKLPNGKDVLPLTTISKWIKKGK